MPHGVANRCHAAYPCQTHMASVLPGTELSARRNGHQARRPERGMTIARAAASQRWTEYLVDGGQTRRVNGTSQTTEGGGVSMHMTLVTPESH